MQGKVEELNNDRAAMERRNKSLRKQVCTFIDIHEVIYSV